MEEEELNSSSYFHNLNIPNTSTPTNITNNYNNHNKYLS